MNILTPTLERNFYKFYENVNGGYLQNSSWASHDIKTSWSKDGNLLSLQIDDENFFPFVKDGKLMKKTEIDQRYWYHYCRARNALARHRRALKIYLGQESAPVTPVGRFVYQSYYQSSIDNVERELTKEGTPKFSGHRGRYVKETAKTLALMKEYNDKLEIWENEEIRLRKALFGE